MSFKIPLFEIYWDEEDIKSVNQIIKRGTYWATGPEIEQFESNISEYIGSKYAVTFNSGTSALHAVLLAYGIKTGQEVIVPSFTFTSTANAPIFVGAKPVFAEIEEKTLGLDPSDVINKITPKTKAIMPVHYGGSPCMIEALTEIAEDNNLIIIEDAAESLGSKIKDKLVGSFGNAAMISFCQNKIITTGEGGCIVTDSDEIYDKLKLIRSHGRLDNVDYFSTPHGMDNKMLGYNFRMSTMTAALGISQLKKIDHIIQLRNNIANKLNKGLSGNESIKFLSLPNNYFSVNQMYTIRVSENIRNDLINHLFDKNIMSKIYFPPIHLTSYYKEKFGYKKGDLPITEKISDQVLSLPIYPNLKINQINEIIKSVLEFWE